MVTNTCELVQTVNMKENFTQQKLPERQPFSDFNNRVHTENRLSHERNGSPEQITIITLDPGVYSRSYVIFEDQFVELSTSKGGE
jgi:hypothetical protein